MDKFVQIVFIFLMIYLGLKILGRWVLPWIIKRWLGKVQKQFYEQNPHLDPQEKEKSKDGEVEIKYNSTTKKPAENVGEYVDFEEIKEK